MKKYIVLWIGIILLGITTPVFATDTVYSLNKYVEEELDFILNSYKDDGYIVAGTYHKEKDENKQLLLMKYKKNGASDWIYKSETKMPEEVYGLAFSYNEVDEKNGYVLALKEKEENYFLQVDDKGQAIQEKEIAIENSTITEMNEFNNSYMVYGTRNDTAFLAKYNKELNLVWIKDYRIDSYKTTIIDTIEIKDNAYYAIVLLEKENEKSYQLIKLDLEGNFIKVVKEDFESTDKPRLEKELDSYIVYGITKEVKLSDKDSGSFYLIKYNLEDEEEWETIGTSPVDEDKTLRIQSNEKEDSIEYLLLATNKSDKSIEVIRIDSEGIVKNKVKKIKNGYYDIHNFIAKENVIYFIGQINCPEDDNCDYDANSLFLVSTEDTVIEVKDNDSKTILIVMGVLIVGILFMYIWKKKKILKK